MRSMNQHVWQVTSTSRPTLGTQLTPWKGLAQNGQGNVQSLSLVWQKARLGSSPYCLEDREKMAANTEGTPAGAGRDGTKERVWLAEHSEGQRRVSWTPSYQEVASP